MASRFVRRNCGWIVRRWSHGMLAAALVMGGWSGLARGVAGEEVESGPAVGATVVSFDVKDCTGPAAGKTLCYLCRYGSRPVIAVFLREVSDEVAALLKRIDDEVAKRREQRVAAFVILLAADTVENERRLKAIAAERRLAHTPLTIARNAGGDVERKFTLAANAAVTLVIWDDLQTRSCRAMATSKISAEQADSVLEWIGKATSGK